MRPAGTARIVLPLLVCGAMYARPSLAQVPAGGTFTVATSTTFDRHHAPSVAVTPTGDFVIFWNWFQPNENTVGEVLARRFGPAGDPRGPVFQVNTWTTGHQYSRGQPSISPLRNRDFLVVWTDSWVGGPRGRILGPDGPRSPELGLGMGPQAAVAGASDGHYVVASAAGDAEGWTDIRARLFDSRGIPDRPSFLVNTYTTGVQSMPSIGARPDGSFVVAWAGYGGGSGGGIFGQRFAADGTRLGAEFRVDVHSGGYPGSPSVAVDAEGGFVVTWGHGVRIYARRYDRDGTPVGAGILVNPATALQDLEPTVASDGSGNFVVTWSRGSFEAGRGVWGRRFRADMTPRGEAFMVAPIDLWASSPRVASDPQGNLVVTWDRTSNPFQLAARVLARRYGGLVPAALQADTMAVAGASDGNRVLEACETVDVRPAWGNLNGQAQSFAGDVLSFTGPGGADYTVLDAAGGYGTVLKNGTGPCQDCYAVSVSCPTSRPATHWDATLTEQLRPDAQGQSMRWSLHIGESFTDVPRQSPYYRSVETLLHRGLTAGCAPARFCGAASMTRGQMAVMVLQAAEGAFYRPRDCGSPRFRDVPTGSPLCPYVEELARRGVVSGCGGGDYCPGDRVSRAQMAVFVTRTAFPDVVPPACGSPLFSDVPADDPFCPWIENLAQRGVVAGCGGGRFCPSDAVTREQVAVFLASGFRLTLYGP